MNASSLWINVRLLCVTLLSSHNVSNGIIRMRFRIRARVLQSHPLESTTRIPTRVNDTLNKQFAGTLPVRYHNQRTMRHYKV